MVILVTKRGRWSQSMQRKFEAIDKLATDIMLNAEKIVYKILLITHLGVFRSSKQAKQSDTGT